MEMATWSAVTLESTPAPAAYAGESSILLVEPDRFSQIILRTKLQSMGYEVHSASTGKEALTLARQHQPLLIVVPWVLPDMGGKHFFTEIRNDPETSQAFVVALVENGMRSKVYRVVESGADECVMTPCTQQDLLSRVRVGLRVAELQQCLAKRNDEYRHVTARLNEELTVVSNIQKVLLPQKIPSCRNLDFTSFYLPSTECGGDYYDLVQLDDTHQGFVIADVSGHGAPSMVAMAMIRQNFHIISSRFKEPHLLLEELNRLLFDHLPTDQYATMLYTIINTETLECLYASAGHGPPFWYRAKSGETTKLENCEGFPLKLVTRDATYESHCIQLAKGDKLVFYTDGIPECFNAERELYGLARFEEVIRQSASALPPRLLETVIVTDLMRFADNHPQEDDLTLAIFGVK